MNIMKIYHIQELRLNNLFMLFERCLSAPYIHIDKTSADYYVELIDDVLYIYLESSSGIYDWESNLNFPAIPYRRMGKSLWFCHRGFLRVWRSIEERISSVIVDKIIKKIITVGYSHGGALATLCHEYVWFNRRDLKDLIEGYAFGAPRVLWGIPIKAVSERWKNFSVIRNANDIVTFLPPKIFGYYHVGNMIEIGDAKSYSPTAAHRPENILYELSKL